MGEKVVTDLSTTWLVRWTHLQRTAVGYCNEEPMTYGAFHFDPTYYKRFYPGP